MPFSWPNQRGAVEPKKRAAFMPMTATKTYPKAMQPAWNDDGLSRAMFCNTLLSGVQRKDRNGQRVLGYAGTASTARRRATGWRC